MTPICFSSKDQICIRMNSQQSCRLNIHQLESISSRSSPVTMAEPTFEKPCGIAADSSIVELQHSPEEANARSIVPGFVGRQTFEDR